MQSDEKLWVITAKFTITSGTLGFGYAKFIKFISEKMLKERPSWLKAVSVDLDLDSLEANQGE